jgi:hypothetical protein
VKEGNENEDKSETWKVLADMLRDGLSIEPQTYLAYLYGPPECWPDDKEAALPGVLKKVSRDDRVGRVAGSV